MNPAILWNQGPGQSEALRQWAPIVLVAAVILALGLGGEAAREWGRFEREGLAGWELWRLITAHLVHLSWGHLWLNLIALVLMAALFGDLMRPVDWLVAGLGSAIAIDIGLLLYHDDIDWYVGLSGVLHGLMLVGGLRLARSGSALGYVVLIGFAAKLLWEQTSGPLPFSESTSGGPVLVNAHLYGTIGGGAALASMALVRRLGQL